MIYIEKHDGEIFIGNNTDLSRNATDAGMKRPVKSGNTGGL